MSLGTIEQIELNASNAKKLTDDVLDLISRKQRLNQDIFSAAARACEFGIKREENETEESYLVRIAELSTATYYKLKAQEALEGVALITTGKARPQKRGIAGLLQRAADKLERL